MQFTQVHRTEQEKVFISAQNNQGAALTPGLVVEFTNTTTNADQGRLVELVDAANSTVEGVGAAIAGVVETTIATGEVGRIQVYGPINIEAAASIAAGKPVCAFGAGGNDGHVEVASAAAASSVGGASSLIGVQMEESGGTNSNACVFVQLM